MINLDAPQMALQGNTYLLSCMFELSSSSSSASKQQATATTARHQQTTAAGDEPAGMMKTDDGNKSGISELLYAIKWYKDGKEFYRYLAQERKKKLTWPVDGVQLDVDKSDNQTIILRSVGLRSSGLYRCEVYTDAPHFTTKSIERRLLVYALPNEGPSIEMIKPEPLRRQLVRGDPVKLECSAPESKPPLSLDWIINDTLNLSSTQNNGAAAADINSREMRHFFNFSSLRYVRLPASLTTNNVAAGRSRTTNPISGQPSQIFYLIQNGSLASPPTPPPSEEAASKQLSVDKPQVINLTGSLDRLPERSTTKLNFTVDADLFAYLNRTAAAAAAAAAAQGTSHKSRIKLKDHSRRPSTKKATTTLRIRCVARVMHLSMSDEIKLDLVADDNRPTSAEANPRIVDGGQVVKSSAKATFCLGKIWILYFITTFVCLLALEENCIQLDSPEAGDRMGVMPSRR